MTPNTLENQNTTDESTSNESSPGHAVECSESVTRYVVVEINGNHYGMPTDSTVELMSASMSPITRVPHSPEFITGVINHRGTIIPVIEMRILLGFEQRDRASLELEAVFAEFKSDHADWLDALERSVKEDVPFEKETNPDHSRFGRWYNSVMDGSVEECSAALSEPVIQSIVERFDAPHRRIHVLAERVLAMRDEGDAEGALAMINNARDADLKAIIDHFGVTTKAIEDHYRSMLVITEHEGKKAALAVDGVSFVVDCSDESIEPLPDTADNTEFLGGLVHRGDGGYILIADLGNIYTTACIVQ